MQTGVIVCIMYEHLGYRTLYSVQCTLYTVHRTTVHNMHNTMYIVRRTAVFDTMYTIRCTLYDIGSSVCVEGE